jgi:hypothetical protein
MGLLDAPRSSLVLVAAALALGCSVGQSGDGFTGPALTFGGPGTSAEDGSGNDTVGVSDDSGNDSATSRATSEGSADGTDSPPADTVDCVPTEELCNGLDDDCDGEIDNGDPEAGQPCNTGNPGPCAAGTTACDGGAVVCAPDVAASAEMCDGVDNDCNGQVDDGVGGGDPCNTGLPGVCADGNTTCEGGVQCVPVTPASNEACDGLDNDCNGVVDDGNPGGGGACNTGMPGVCSAGTQQCSGGGLVCQQNQGAAADEVCGNGLDDDCNGAAEDGCNTCSHDICLEGGPLVNGCDPCVTQICALDSWCCTNSWDSLCVDEVGTICGIAC